MHHPFNSRDHVNNAQYVEPGHKYQEEEEEIWKSTVPALALDRSFSLLGVEENIDTL